MLGVQAHTTHPAFEIYFLLWNIKILKAGLERWFSSSVHLLSLSAQRSTCLCLVSARMKGITSPDLKLAFLKGWVQLGAESKHEESQHPAGPALIQMSKVIAPKVTGWTDPGWKDPSSSFLRPPLPDSANPPESSPSWQVWLTVH